MPRKEHALPEPPRDKKRVRESSGKEKDGLIFDKLQEAMAGGRLEKFIRENIPGGEYARRLTGLMMGMSGMPPRHGAEEKKGADKSKNKMEELPADVLHAVREGNAEKLQGLLEREQERRSGLGRGKKKEEAAGDAMAGQANAVQSPDSLIEKEVIDNLMEIGVDNGLSMDWLILRALKLYIRKYMETGQL